MHIGAGQVVIPVSIVIISRRRKKSFITFDLLWTCPLSLSSILSPSFDSKIPKIRKWKNKRLSRKVFSRNPMLGRHLPKRKKINLPRLGLDLLTVKFDGTDATAELSHTRSQFWFGMGPWWMYIGLAFKNIESKTRWSSLFLCHLIFHLCTLIKLQFLHLRTIYTCVFILQRDFDVKIVLLTAPDEQTRFEENAFVQYCLIPPFRYLNRLTLELKNAYDKRFRKTKPDV